MTAAAENLDMTQGLYPEKIVLTVGWVLPCFHLTFVPEAYFVMKALREAPRGCVLLEVLRVEEYFLSMMWLSLNVAFWVAFLAAFLAHHRDHSVDDY